VSRRRCALASVCAAALALVALAAPASAAPSQPYEHVWQAEGMVGGDLGGKSGKDVSRDAMDLALRDGRFDGHLQYADTLTIDDGRGEAKTQSASIEVTLTGLPAEGGLAAAGAFSGVARLVTRPAGMAGNVASPGYRELVYDVSGHWGARLSGGVASGELLYERATVVTPDAGYTDLHGAEWFDRLSAEKGGGAQTFQVEVAGLAAGQPKTTPAAGGGSSAATGAGSSRPLPPVSADAAQQPRLGFWGFVARGLAGRPGVAAVPVPLALSGTARTLKDAAPPGATQLPPDAVGSNVDVAGLLLDSQNRAAGLLGTAGPAGDGGRKLDEAWRRAEALQARTTIQGSIAAALRRQSIPGAGDLASDLEAAAKNGNADSSLIAAWNAVVRAVAAADGRSVLAATAAETNAVATAALPRTGPLADAVLAAAQAPHVPASAAVVAAMPRDPSLDATAQATATLLPARVLAAQGGSTGGGPASLTYATPTGRTTVAPSSWPAYRRADGTVFWLAGFGGPVALTDGTLRGAGFTTGRAYLVDATDVGRIFAVYDLR
jgi:hypothetical protein